MKEILLSLVLLLGLYPTSGIVTDIDCSADLVTVQLQNGHMYQFYSVEDWAEGDIAAMIMNDCGTPEVYDDKIVSVRYVGYCGSKLQTKETAYAFAEK